MGDPLLQHIADDVRELRKDVKQLDSRMDSFVKETEHRISKMEERAGLFGAAAGLLSSIVFGLAKFFGLGAGQ